MNLSPFLFCKGRKKKWNSCKNLQELIATSSELNLGTEESVAGHAELKNRNRISVNGTRFERF